MAEMIE